MGLQKSWTQLASLVTQSIKHLPAVQETWVWSLGREDPLEKGMATHYSILAWRIPWMEEPGRLQSTGSQRFRQDWTTSLATKTTTLTWSLAPGSWAWPLWPYLVPSHPPPQLPGLLPSMPTLQRGPSLPLPANAPSSHPSLYSLFFPLWLYSFP